MAALGAPHAVMTIPRCRQKMSGEIAWKWGQELTASVWCLNSGVGMIVIRPDASVNNFHRPPMWQGGIGRCTFSMERRSPFQSLIFGSLLNAPSQKKVTFSQNCQKLKFCWSSWRIQPIWKISVSVKLFIFPIFEGKNILKRSLKPPLCNVSLCISTD